MIRKFWLSNIVPQPRQDTGNFGEAWALILGMMMLRLFLFLCARCYICDAVLFSLHREQEAIQ